MDTPKPKRSKAKKLVDLTPGTLVVHKGELYEVVRKEGSKVHLWLPNNKSLVVPASSVEVINVPLEVQKELEEESNKTAPMPVKPTKQDKLHSLLLSQGQQDLLLDLGLAMEIKAGNTWKYPAYPNPLVASQSGGGLATALSVLAQQSGLPLLTVSMSSWNIAGSNKTPTLEILARNYELGEKAGILHFRSMHLLLESKGTWWDSVREEVKLFASGKLFPLDQIFLIGSGYFNVTTDEWTKSEYKDPQHTLEIDTSWMDLFQLDPLQLEPPTSSDLSRIFKHITGEDLKILTPVYSFYDLSRLLYQHRIDRPAKKLDDK